VQKREKETGKEKSRDRRRNRRQMNGRYERGGEKDKVEIEGVSNRRRRKREKT
jgi:hypothetical protein